MSSYGLRDRPAYRRFDPGPYDNPNIEQWWTAKHDDLLKRLIDQWQWHWYWEVTDAVVSMTPEDVLESFRKREKILQGAWYNRIMYFAISRAKNLGLTTRIRKPQWKICPLCNEKFIEDSLPAPFTRRLGGMDNLDFCSPCLKISFFDSNDFMSKVKVLEYLRDLTNVLKRIPNQGFGDGIDDLHDMDFKQRLDILQVLQRKPSVKRVKQLFGSWLKALIESEVLNEDARRTARGTQCIAKDGHICHSLGEKTIDDFLHVHSIPHDKEPIYPNSDFSPSINYRADFAVNNILIEYFGLKGDHEYDKKIKEKQRFCKNNNIFLISIYPSDLVSKKRLERKLRIILSACD